MNQVIFFVMLLIVIIITALSTLLLCSKLLIKKRKEKALIKTRVRLKRNVIVLCSLMVILSVFSLFSQLFAKTPPILDANGNVLENSIAELTKIELNNRKEWISIRGENKDNPILLFLAGGPGGTQMAAVRHDLAELEEHYVVVNWDQPGSGKSYANTKNKLVVDDYINDGIALTDYLRERFNKDKIILVGESWGSALGIFLATEAPEKYQAFIGTGQMIDFLKTELIDYELAMEIALKNNDTKKVKKLKENGKPPYYGSDVTFKSAEYINYLSATMSNNSKIHNNGYNTFRDIFSSEYGIIDKINYFRALIATYNHVYPQLYDIDLRKDFTKIQIPVYFFLGRHDINAPLSLVEEYVEILDAPKKEIIYFEHSGHNPWINESEKFITELLKHTNN